MVTTRLQNATTVVQATRFPITSVKLFRSSGAEVVRAFSLSFLGSQDGPHVVEIAHLPANIHLVDVSVTSKSGNLTILDYHHATDTFPAPSSPTLLELQAEKQRLKDEKRIREQSFTFLSTYMDSLAQGKSHHQPEAAQMVSFFDDFVETGSARSALIAELDAKLAEIENKIENETKRLEKLNKNLPLKVVAVLARNNEEPVEAAQLNLTYTVKQVHWKPEYDLHVSMVGDTPSPTVRLDFRCSVMQWTGEDWDNVSLALTTANQASQLIQLPEPKNVEISLNAVPKPIKEPVMRMPLHQYVSQSKLASRAVDPVQPLSCNVPAPVSPNFGGEVRMCRRQGAESDGYGSVHACRVPSEPARDRWCRESRRMESNDSDEQDVQSQTISQLVAHGNKDPITHTATGCIFIPTDRTWHHILVTSIPLQAEFMRIATPSVDSRVYYICEVQNTSDCVLLPGTVKTHLNGQHVSSTQIQNTDAPQILECPLAVDTCVKTIHNHAPDALPSFGHFSGKATTTYTGATVVQNTHAEAIRGVVVRSAIPLPADPRITIVLKEPRGLAEIDEGSVSVKEGCLARWSTTGGRKGKQAGLFEWVCDVHPGSEVLKAVWEVCAPQEMKLIEQERT